jgi:hypothetical protein
MLDSRRISWEFADMGFLENNRMFSNMTVLVNKFCPCCANYHDMLLIKPESDVNKILDDNYANDDASAEERKQAYEDYKRVSRKEPDRVYCPYLPMTDTGWDQTLYQILVDDYKKVYSYKGPKAKEYQEQVNKILPRLEKTREALEELCQIRSMSDEIKKEMAKYQELMKEMVMMRDFIKRNKDKVYDIVNADLQAQHQDRINAKANANNAPDWNGKWQNWAEHFWDCRNR